LSGVKIDRFLGEAPKLASELLPETAAGFAYNTKLYSGNLIPYNKSSVVQAFEKTGTIQSIYPLDDGVGGFKWLHWTQDVDVARAPIQNDTTQRIYYTGEAEPRVSNYSLATTGGGTAYPYGFYTLGLPAPITAPTAAAVSFTTLVLASRARDSGNTATLTFAAAHGLLSGTYVTMTLVAGTGYNLTNAQITVTSPTTFSYYCPGAAETTTADTTGRVDLSGVTKTRTYVYTWYTAWGDESVPSPVSGSLYMKDGQTVNITGLPSAWLGSYVGTYQTVGLSCRLYRTISSSSGTLYYKVADIPLGTTTYTDTVQDNVLTVALPALYYDQPAANMVGLKALHNGIMVGFFGNTVCFSEPGQPHAWPLKYRMQLDTDVVAVDNVGQTIVVLTKKNPWVVSGTHPALMNKTRMDYVLACTSKRGVVNMGYGLVFPTPGGLAVYSTSTGGDLLTKAVHDWDTWRIAVDYTTLLAKQYNGRYFATSSKGSFMFERNDQIGGYLVELDQPFTAVYYDPLAPNLYYANSGSLYKWDDATQPYGQFDWKSKTLVTQDYLNLGAARVIADYGSNPNDIAIAAANNQTLISNQAAITNKTSGGSIGGSSFGTVFIAGDTLIPLQPLTSGVQFQLYVDKTLVHSAQIADKEIFRLPTGYRSDTFEVRLTGNTRVRAIHLAETPFGLKKV